MPGGGILNIRMPAEIVMIGAIPIPSDTIQTNVNARAFASDWPAYNKSAHILLNMRGLYYGRLCIAK
jgi:hypothetical protein